MPRKSSASLQIVTPRGPRLEAPLFLSDEQVAEWNSIVGSLPSDYLRPSDVPLLAAYVIASATHKQAAAELEETGLLGTDNHGRKFANPLSNVMRSQASTTASLATKLRLCPSSRYTPKVAGTQTNGHGTKPPPWEFRSRNQSENEQQ